jgi:ATP-dependent Clp protease ATP-binding subunit ClpC
VLFFARYEVGERGSPSIETEHLLLGILREGNGVSARFLSTPPLTMEAIRSEIDRRSPLRKRVSTSVEVPFSEQSRRVIQFSADEADRLRHTYVGPEHILIGLIREEGSVAASILTGLGVELEAVRSAVVRISGDALPPAAPVPSIGDAVAHLKALVERLERAAAPEARTRLASLVQRELDDLEIRLRR